MIEQELGSFNFAFDMKNFYMKDEFFDVSMFELGFQARNLITKPDKYVMNRKSKYVKSGNDVE